MSDKTILSQRLNEQLNDFRKAMDKFAESCIKIVEKYGLSSDETECEQPDSDTISRQDAINLIERYCDNGCEIAEDKWCPDCQQSKFAEMIKALPPSPSRPPWIPCSERLPEEYGEYRITWVTSCAPSKRFIGDSEYEITSVWDEERKDFKGEWLLDDYIKHYPDVKVIAWKPLEEPYQEEGD